MNQGNYKIILGFLRANGNPQHKFVQDFCRENQLKIEDLLKVAGVKPEKTLENRLEEHGLLDGNNQVQSS